MRIIEERILIDCSKENVKAFREWEKLMQGRNTALIPMMFPFHGVPVGVRYSCLKVEFGKFQSLVEIFHLPNQYEDTPSFKAQVKKDLRRMLAEQIEQDAIYVIDEIKEAG